MLSMQNTGSRLHLECPFCRKTIDVSQMTHVGGVTGGLACPECKKWVVFSQPFTLFRRTLSLLLSALVMLRVGVHPIWLYIGGVILLWLPMSIAVDAYMAHKLPLKLGPWTAPTSFRSYYAPVSLRDALKAEQDSRDGSTKAAGTDLNP